MPKREIGFYWSSYMLKDDCKIKDYDYIFVDEYQDTSYNKYKFLKELKNRTDAKLIVIGDDWQSIYGFNGCEIELFTHFEDYFDYTKKKKKKKTYRNSNELIDISSNFIKENTSQTMKDLYSDKNLPKKPIKLTKTSNPKRFALIFKSIIDEIIQNYPDGEILILGRYNKDFKKILVPDLFECENSGDYMKILKEKGFLTIRYLERKDIIIKFRTIHKSKGLQADNIIMIGLKDDKDHGFPSLYGNDPLINHILNRQTEDVEFPEERRLFYVALTRTKNNVFLIADKINPSRFVEKILYLDKNNSIEFREYDFDTDEIIRMNNLLKKQTDSIFPTKLSCKKCGGIIVLEKKNKKGYFKCEKCNFNYGHFNQSIDLLDSLTFCKEKGCKGLNYIYGGKYRNCTMFYKTKCNPKLF